MDDNNWKISKENKQHIDGSLADFLLGQAEKALRHTIDIADKTTNRAFTIALILLPLVSTIIGLLINAIKTNSKYRQLDIYFFSVIIVICALALFYLFKLVFPRFFMTFGREPKHIVVDEMLQNSLSAEKKLLAYKFNEIKNYQNKIDYNRDQNEKRILLLSRILKIVGVCALVAVFLYLIILFRMETV